MMAGRALRALRAWWRKRQLIWFRPRQLILRDGDAIHSVDICSRVQKGVALVVMTGLLFTLFMTIGYFVQSHALAGKRDEVERTRTAYHELIEEIAGQQSKVNGITRDLEHYRNALLDLLQHNERMSSDLQQFAHRLETERNEKLSIAEQEKALRDQLQGMERDLSNVSERNDYLQLDVGGLRQRLAGSESERVRMNAARTALERRLLKLEDDLAQAQIRAAEAEKQTLTRQAALDAANVQRRAAIVERDATAQRAAQIEERMAGLRKQHEEMVGRLAERTRVALTELERVVRDTGLDPQRFQPRRGAAPAAPAVPPPAPDAPVRLPGEMEGAEAAQGAGGPFIPESTSRTKGRAAGADSMLSLPDLSAKEEGIHSDIERLEGIRKIVASLPLTVPLPAYRVQSLFGVRSDPFRGRRAFHEGIDLSAPLMTLVRATAGGRVVSAAWNGAYGRMVEIDHGNGFSTRYAHLAKMLVSEGQIVTRRTPIGHLGSSGRSSGPHVHYEVLINGQQVNPARFMKVPLNVQ